MNNSIAIITCGADWWQFEFLMRTLVKHAGRRERVIVVINEPEDLSSRLESAWRHQFPKIARKHSVQFVPAEDLYAGIRWPNRDAGWVWQQVLKILVHDRVTTPGYVLLDSKNFFVAPFTADDILNSQPGHLHAYDAGRVRTTRYYCDLLGVPFDGVFMHNITPFVMQCDVCSQLVAHWGGVEKFSEWFWDHSLDDGYSPMEFHLYDVFSRTIPNGRDTRFSRTHSNYSTLWDHMKGKQGWSIDRCVREIIRLRDEGVVVSGLHKSFISLSTATEVYAIMARLGLAKLWRPYWANFALVQEHLRRQERRQGQ